MAILTIRNLDEVVKRQLRIQAAEHGVSMEEEARLILRDALVLRIGSRDGPHLSSDPGAGKGEWHLDATLDELLSLGRKPDKPFDLKELSDEMWDESL